LIIYFTTYLIIW